MGLATALGYRQIKESRSGWKRPQMVEHAFIRTILRTDTQRGWARRRLRAKSRGSSRMNDLLLALSVYESISPSTKRSFGVDLVCGNAGQDALPWLYKRGATLPYWSST